MSREIREQIIGELMQAIREETVANDAFDDAAARTLGINRTDMRLLDVIDHHPGPVTAGLLAQVGGLTTAAVTAALDRIEARGYARRRRDPDDRRRVLVEIEASFRERAAPIWGPLGEDATALWERYTDDELRLLRDFSRAGRELNERHLERVLQLRAERG